MATETKIWHLENFNLFKTLSEFEKVKMSTRVKHSKMKKNDYIYFPEDPSSSIFFLKKGRVKIGTYSDNGKEIIKAILNPGEVFGELSLVGQEKRNDFAIPFVCNQNCKRKRLVHGSFEIAKRGMIGLDIQINSLCFNIALGEYLAGTSIKA